ncbi:MAG: MATE family efflux transporter, partial [Candidatus Adiutrix sp.]
MTAPSYENSENSNKHLNWPKTNLRQLLHSMHPARRWKTQNGYSHVLRICLPLIASNISVSAMLFTDRLFLSHYSIEAIAASLPAGVALMTIASFFQGLVAYVSVFAAQYTGAGRPSRAAAALWQGLYLAFISGILLALTYFMAPWMFALVGHPPGVQELEIIYYQVLAVPSIFNLFYFTMSSFLAGLGRTRMVMWVNLIGAIINIPLTYALIFGVKIGTWTLAPEMGIMGAALATAFSWLVTAIIFAALIFTKKMDKTHKIFSTFKLDGQLIKRMIAFGSPSGLQRFLELGAFTYFAFVVGRLGEVYLAANNIVFSIELLSFLPMIGVGTTISILVGQSIGKGDPLGASEAVISGIGISSLYLALI